MNELTTLLEKLALQLGTTVEYLWEVLIKQAHVFAIQYIVCWIILIIGSVLFYIFLKKTVEGYESDGWDETITWHIVPTVLLGVVVFVLLVKNLVQTGIFITAIINPEYWALQEILGQNKTTSRNIALEYLLVLVAAGILYVITCAPGVLWQDSGLFVYRIWHNDLQGNLGLALAHPLYIMIGIAVKYIPLGDLAYRINLISAVFGAVAIANLFLLLRLWLGRVWPAIIGAVTLAVSWNFWQHAVIAEAYTMYMAQLFGELIVLLLYTRTKRIGYLYLLGLFNGLAISNHLWASLALACYMVFVIFLLVKKQIRIRHLAICVLLWVIGALPYEYLIIKNIILTGDLQATLLSAAFGRGWQGSVLNASVSMKTGRLPMQP